MSSIASPHAPSQVLVLLWIKAMAAKLARLVYRIVRYGMKYVDQGAVFYQAQHRHSQIRYVKFKAASLGYQLIQISAA